MITSVEARQSEIIRLLEFERYVKVADLSQRFGVSQMSIRRDLHHLEGQGLLRRVHGGLISPLLLRHGLEISPKVAIQIRDGWSEKDKIARVAASFVQIGDHLIFDSGILSYLTACSLPGDLLIQGKLTVITNSVLIALELAPWPGVETILLGGEYQADQMMSVTGPATLRTLEGLHADKMFLSVDAIDVSHGITSSGDETELTHEMISACSHVILLSTGSKIGRAEQVEILPISAVHTLVTAQGAPAEFISYLRTQGAEVILA